MARKHSAKAGRGSGLLLHWYHGTIARIMKTVTRTQTGVRLETHLLKVLKALATELDLSLGDLLEGIGWVGLARIVVPLQPREVDQELFRSRFSRQR